MPPRKKTTAAPQTEVKPEPVETPVVFGNEKTALTSLARLLHRKGVLDKDEFERVITELG